MVAPGGELAGWLLELDVVSAQLHRAYGAIVERAARRGGGGGGGGGGYRDDDDDAVQAAAAVLPSIVRRDGWPGLRTLVPADAATDVLCQSVALAMAALVQRATAAAAPVSLCELLTELRSAGSPLVRGIDVVRVVFACAREGWLELRNDGAFSLPAPPR